MKHLNLDFPAPFARYLGCNQNVINISSEQSRVYLEHIVLVLFEYNLEEGEMTRLDVITKDPLI